MSSVDLNKLLTGQVFALLFIFCRMAPVFMLLPGFGESYVSARFRGTLALCVSFLLMGPMAPLIPVPPGDVTGLIRLILIEIMIGLYFGSMVRLIMGVLETIGFVIALETGLSNAVVLNPSLATQSRLPSALLAIAGLTLIFATGLDHFLLRSVVATYELFPPGNALPFGDMAQSFLQTFSKSFRIGVELSSPFLIIGTLGIAGLGMIQKLMPQVQLFLVMLPVQVWGGLALMMLTISTTMELWLRFFDQSVGALFTR